MDEPFLISVNCSEVLGKIGGTQYTMFIDNTKMSIVYEVIEWIRFMFSIEECFYLTHENSIIHELEDIQVLSRLRTFELKRCGWPNCVHKRTYRILLNELNLFVNWNERKVHKYFLEKISLIKQKLKKETESEKILSGKNSCQSSIPKTLMCGHIPSVSETELLSSTRVHKELEGVYSMSCNPKKKSKPDENEVQHFNKTDALFITRATATDSPAFEMNDEPFKGRNNEKMEISNENSLIQLVCYKEPHHFGVMENSSSPSKIMKSTTSNLSHSSPVKKEENLKSGSKKTSKDVKKTNNCLRPFSIGALLENIRQELNQETGETKTTTAPTNSPFQEECPQEAIFNSLASEDSKNSGEKKRKRTRKRKKAKKDITPSQEPFIPPTGNEYPASSWFTKSPLNGIKPNHIRFNVDDEEEDLMEIESFEGKDDNENVTNMSNEKKEFSSSEPVKTDVNQLLTMINEKKQALTSSFQGGEECVPDVPPIIGEQIRREEDLIVLNNEDSGSGKITSDISQLENSNSEINNLLSLKDKFKNAVIIERFY